MARTVLVTGGNRGIGSAIARAFAAQGDRVAVTHRGSGAPAGTMVRRRWGRMIFISSVVGLSGSSAQTAAVTAWLASDAAAYITGAVIPVDGGLGMGH